MTGSTRVVATALAATALFATLWGGAPAAAQDEPERRSDGCGRAAPQQAGSSELHTISSGGRDRTFQLHLPDGYDAARPWPLVLVYHGRGNTGAGTEEFSKL